MGEEIEKQDHGTLILATLAGIGIFLFSEALEMNGWDTYKPQKVNSEPQNYDLNSQLTSFDKRYRFIGRWNDSYSPKEELTNYATNNSLSLTLDGKLSSD